METLGGLAIAVIIYVGGSQVILGVTTPGTFFSFLTALLMAYQPIKSLAREEFIKPAPIKAIFFIFFIFGLYF